MNPDHEIVMTPDNPDNAFIPPKRCFICDHELKFVLMNKQQTRFMDTYNYNCNHYDYNHRYSFQMNYDKYFEIIEFKNIGYRIVNFYKDTGNVCNYISNGAGKPIYQSDRRITISSEDEIKNFLVLL